MKLNLLNLKILLTWLFILNFNFMLISRCKNHNIPCYGCNFGGHFILCTKLTMNFMLITKIHVCKEGHVCHWKDLTQKGSIVHLIQFCKFLELLRFISDETTYNYASLLFSLYKFILGYETLCYLSIICMYMYGAILVLWIRFTKDSWT
jgi:hypothetical protein